jgi:uncharacterized protein YbjT (DUF2867 family)
VDAVTGAFSYTGRAIAEELLRRGRPVRTLSRRREPDDPLATRVEWAPLDFSDPRALARRLAGCERLFVTYWIRFERGGSTFARAVANTGTLVRAAREAGVGSVVYLSVTGASPDSPLPYFQGKAACERAVRESGLRYAIVRPTLVFGPEDILVNNIAWALRRFPFFPLAGDGRYSVQPVSVRDTATIAVDAAEGETAVVAAAGPDVLAFVELVRLVRAAVGSRARLVHAPAPAVLALGRVVGLVQRDVLLTREELAGLRAGLLVAEHEPLGRDPFADWVERHGDTLGRRYVSELARNFRPYRPL